METTNNNANLPLQPFWKFFAFIFPLVFLGIIIVNPYLFEPKKYKSRYEETWSWITIGFLFWILLAWVIIGFIAVSG